MHKHVTTCGLQIAFKTLWHWPVFRCLQPIAFKDGTMKGITEVKSLIPVFITWLSFKRARALPKKKEKKITLIVWQISVLIRMMFVLLLGYVDLMNLIDGLFCIFIIQGRWYHFSDFIQKESVTFCPQCMASFLTVGTGPVLKTFWGIWWYAIGMQSSHF